MIAIGNLVCAVDFSATSHRAFEYAVTIADKFAAELTVLHVLEEVPLLTAYSGHPELGEVRHAEDSARSQLAGWIARAGADGLRVRVEVIRGVTEETILGFCRQHRPDLLVMGTHGRRFLDAALFGSVTHRVIRRAPCPVLLVQLSPGGQPYEAFR